MGNNHVYIIFFIGIFIILILTIVKLFGKKIISHKGRKDLVNNSEFILRNKRLIEKVIYENTDIQNSKKKTILAITILVIFVITGMIIAFKTSGQLFFISAILFVLGIIIMLSFDASYKVKFKNQVIGKIIKLYNPNFNYYPNNGFNFDEYSECRFPEDCDIYHSEDLITDNNSTFRYADIEIESEHEDKDGHTYTITEYEGSLAFIDIKDVNCEIYLGAMAKSWFSKEYQHIKFENDTFNKLFSAYSTSEFNAYKILTPDVMEQFVHLKENTYGDIDIRLLNNRLYVRFLSGDGFVPSLFNKKGEMNSIVSSLAVLEEVQKTMQNVKNIIEKKDLS